jgi:hypothetical protein
MAPRCERSGGTGADFHGLASESIAVLDSLSRFNAPAASVGEAAVVGLGAFERRRYAMLLRSGGASREQTEQDERKDSHHESMIA